MYSRFSKKEDRLFYRVQKTQELNEVENEKTGIEFEKAGEKDGSSGRK